MSETAVATESASSAGADPDRVSRTELKSLIGIPHERWGERPKAFVCRAKAPLRFL